MEKQALIHLKDATMTKPESKGKPVSDYDIFSLHTQVMLAAMKLHTPRIHQNENLTLEKLHD